MSVAKGTVLLLENGSFSRNSERSEESANNVKMNGNTANA